MAFVDAASITDEAAEKEFQRRLVEGAAGYPWPFPYGYCDQFQRKAANVLKCSRRRVKQMLGGEAKLGLVEANQYAERVNKAVRHYRNHRAELLEAGGWVAALAPPDVEEIEE